MASAGGKVVQQFRKTFQVIDKEALHWFPGHMSKGLRQMERELKNVDCIIEVHDARIPISGRFINFKHTISGVKPHIFVLNKKDLADNRYNSSIVERLTQEGISNILFTNFKHEKCTGMKRIVPLAEKLIKESNRYNRVNESEFAIMVIGVPNVGKSSLINRLRNVYLGKTNATRVGAVAGITQSLLNRIKISEDPPIYLFDTPGILTPSVKDVHSGLKLALAGCLQDHLVGQEVIADYLLFWLNKHNKFEYVDELGLSEPNDNIIEVLCTVALKSQKTKRIKNFDSQLIVRPDITFAANHFIKIFRNGRLGNICLDSDLLEISEKQFNIPARSSRSSN